MVGSRMALRTLLVGTDLTEHSDRAIVRGHRLSLSHGARLVVCHVLPDQLGSHPLFPQQYEQEVISSTNRDEQIAEAVSQRVVELTAREPDAFDVIIDRGDVARVLGDHARRLSADLTIVMADAPGETLATITRDLARESPCSMLVVGESSATGVAVVALAGESEQVPALVKSACAVASSPPDRIVVVLFVTDAAGVPATETWGPHLAALSAELGVAVEPWFARDRRYGGTRTRVDRSHAGPRRSGRPSA